MPNNDTEFINELVKLTKLYESCTLKYKSLLKLRIRTK